MAKRGLHADDVVVFFAWALAIGLIAAAALGARLLIDPSRQTQRHWETSAQVEPGSVEASVEPGLFYPVHGPVPNEMEMRAAEMFSFGEAPQPSADRAPDERPGAVVVNPSWREQPRPYYPDVAAHADVESGRVQLECFVRADGLIAACSVTDETPVGYGFGRAAIAATHDARLQPRSVDGVTRPGRVRFSIRFRLE